MARRRLPDLADDHRCTRNGTNWRCHLPRLPGKSYCQKHHLFNLARSQSRSKSKSSQSQTLTPSPKPSANRALLREIWAFHLPSPDARPRLYARIERRIPNQCLVEVTPLLPYPNPTADAACGVFKATDSTEAREMGTFSHRVWFEIGGSEGELYKIFPRKGEIWAVEEYRWVEMMTSFGDVEGASGIVLVVVEEGEAKGVFRRRLYEGCELIRRFSVEEMGMFSHRVSGARVLGVGQGLLLQVLLLTKTLMKACSFKLFWKTASLRRRSRGVSVANRGRNDVDLPLFALLLGCVLEKEAENETCLQRQVTIYHQSEVCNNVLVENVIQELAPDPIGNEGENELAPDPIGSEGENEQASEGVSTGSDAYEITSRGTESVRAFEENHQQSEICSINSKEVAVAQSVESICT